MWVMSPLKSVNMLLTQFTVPTCFGWYAMTHFHESHYHVVILIHYPRVPTFVSESRPGLMFVLCSLIASFPSPCHFACMLGTLYQLIGVEKNRLYQEILYLFGYIVYVCYCYKCRRLLISIMSLFSCPFLIYGIP